MRSSNKISAINPEYPQSDIVAEAAGLIKAGGVVCLPTRCLYGLGADALNPESTARVFELKQRPADMPLLVLIDNLQQMEHLVRRVPPNAIAIIEKFWPGRVTLVFDARDVVSPVLTGGSRKIGVRQPGHAVAAALVRAVGRPITGTSANLSGKPGCRRIEDLDPAIANNVDLTLDAGDLAGGKGSTVVDVTVNPPKILREGVVAASEILESLR